MVGTCQWNIVLNEKFSKQCFSSGDSQVLPVSKEVFYANPSRMLGRFNMPGNIRKSSVADAKNGVAYETVRIVFTDR